MSQLLQRPRATHEVAKFRGSSSHTQPSVYDGTVILRDIVLESGQHLEGLELSYRLEGAINDARDNVVLAVHSLTGDVRASDWWRGVVGVHEAVDTSSNAVLCATLAGSPGSRVVTDSASTEDSIPSYTVRDQALILAKLLDELHVKVPRLVIGGSLGGMVTLEFAASFPERVSQAIVIAAPAAQTAQGIAWNAIMRKAIEIGGATEGLALARMVGMLSYRTPEGLERRFGRTRDENGKFSVERWLSAHGDRLVARYDSEHYNALINAMDTQDIGRGRGGICAALAPVRHRITAVGIAGDLLYPAEAVREWALLAGTRYEEITSPHGHDAFLLETGRVSSIVRRVLAAADKERSSAQASKQASKFGSRASGSTTSDKAQRPLRVAIAGCGNVGGALLHILTQHSESQHAESQQRPIEVVRVLARDGERVRPALLEAVKSGITENERCITNAEQLLEGDIDVLVEAIGGTGVAAELVEAALRRGVRVVTANKALLALHGSSLQALATASGTRIDFEASVGGAVPVIRCLRAGAAGVDIKRISGILNGTTNFVLDQLSQGRSFSEAVREAQDAGYAEADPTRDLSGEDIEDKLRVLAWLAFGADPASVKVARKGLDEETAAWASEVSKQGDRVKLIASCERVGDNIVARIAPERVAANDAWAQVTGPANRIVVESASAGALVFHGAGAGGLATAGAIFADLIA